MSDGGRLVLGTRKGLILMERARSGWRVVRSCHAGHPISYAAMDPRSEVLWACADHGHWGPKLSRSRDLGESWEEIECPAYPEGAEVKAGVPAALTYIWYLAPGGGDRPERLYLGTEPGGLFRSDDGGDSFTLIEGLWNHPSRMEQWFGGGRDQPGLHSVVVDPRDSTRILIGISCAGVFESTDDGKSWEPRNKGLYANFLPDPQAEVGQDPHFVVAAPSDPDRLWQQNHCGIFRSTDGAATWQAVSAEGDTAHFGFAIAVDEDDPETAWVVPARSDEMRTTLGASLCVCRTQDGGASWQELRKGLPQQNCHDLIFRHAMDLRGEKLAMGSTTGNVFLSEDKGDSWSCLGNHFPPIYSLRFV